MPDSHTPQPHEQADVAEIEALLRDLDTDDLELVDPPADVWEGIEQHLETSDVTSDEPSADRATTDVSPVVGPVVSLADRRRRLLRPLLAVAAVSGLLIAGAVIISTRPDGSAEVLANARLQYDPANFDPLGEQASASVSLVEDDAGLAITIDEANLPSDLTESADLEIWLIEPDADGNVIDLVSLGLVDGDTFTVPAGYDPALYSVVDISVEPRDGDDAHSGRSILRGALANA